MCLDHLDQEIVGHSVAINHAEDGPKITALGLAVSDAML
jgi:hypothetical protein